MATAPTTQTTPAAANPVIPVDGTHNFRSAGGYAAGDRTVRERKLFRSDALHRLTEGGRSAVEDLGITTVIDLRDASELESAPSAVGGLPLTIAHTPIFDSVRVPGIAAVTSLGEVYRLIVERHADRLAAAVRHIADSGDGAVLVHCTAGKDRTGLVVATALLAVGVDREQVLADYAASGENLSGAWADAMLAAVERHVGGSIDETTRELVTASPAEVLAEALDVLDALHGSAAGLLRAHGFTDADLARLRDVLTAPTR
ncbi:tyrosine-protein phosphatase [Sinomonas sp. ASV322]|uniref:tyrosine-protein phosphatase n=1 Tax=Sinomonas sp. ASV322 TaxID=3041920 RepID=UPI0027DDD5CF|nr:tyrosine-protein phosphatase [Sinomonas sp. ASV322]MDQ4501473.1 tyrosine-protein phosphatase [Sinomonas sp. ASV322]